MSIIVTLAVAGMSLVMLFERQILRYVEHDLQVRWSELATVIGTGSTGDFELGQRLTDPRYQRPYGGAYWQVSEGGTVVLRSRSLWDGELPSRDTRAAEPAAPYEGQGPDGSWLHVFEQQVTTDGNPAQRVYNLAVALDQSQVAERRQAFSWDVARILVPISAVLVFFAWLQIWLGLRPLKSVSEQLSAVRAGHIRRMTTALPNEIASLVASINELLDRQETLIGKARDRAGVLAHGLKTPLTVLGAEVRRLDQSGFKDEAKRIQEQLSAIRNHVDRELARSRTSGTPVGCGAYTAVEPTINRLLKLMQHMPRGEEIAWRTDIPPDLGVNMDPHDFGEVLGNLLDNARKWARTQVTVRVTENAGQARISVEDDGLGISGSHNHRQLEPNPTVTSDAASTGLGLGIVEDVLAEYGTKPTILQQGRFSVCFDIPLCSKPSSNDYCGPLREEQSAEFSLP
jgi:signal transduction histidine kinase